MNQDEQNEINDTKAARTFLDECGIDPASPDAIDQLVQVFLPCLRIMCDPAHPWDPNGATWRKSGILGAMTDAKKKWERFFERTWHRGKRHDDSGYDLINYIGFVMRSDPDSRWGEWGEPGVEQANHKPRHGTGAAMDAEAGGRHLKPGFD